MNFGRSPPPPSKPPPPYSAPSSSLSNYIIIFLSIKIRMNNLNVWQQPGSEREGFCSAAGRQGCFWWATLNWHCCGAAGKKKKAKQNNERRKKNPPKNFTPVKFYATTSKVWHRNMLADMKYVTRLQQVEAHCRVGKHLSICGCFVEFNSSQRLYRRDSRSETILPYEASFEQTEKQFAGSNAQRHVEFDSDSRWTSDEIMSLCIKHEIPPV